MIYAGIDASTSNTGVVVLSEAGELLTARNSSDIPKIKGPKHVVRYLRLEAIADFVVNTIREHGSECRIGYEDYSYDSTHKAEVLGELGGVLRLRLIREFGEVLFIAPTSLKKFAVGHGHAAKTRIREGALQECPGLADLSERQCTHDVCDAYFLARAALYASDPKTAAREDTNNRLVRTRLSAADTWSAQWENS